MERIVRLKRSLPTVFAIAALVSSACTGVGPLGPAGIELRVTVDNPVLEAIGSRTQLELEFPDGVDPVGLEAIWRSSAPAVASVDENGMVTALSQGVATITAEAGGLSASTTITVDANIVSTAQVRSNQTDPNPGNNSATVTITVMAN
jgi:hypothetical protein